MRERARERGRERDRKGGVAGRETEVAFPPRHRTLSYPPLSPPTITSRSLSLSFSLSLSLALSRSRSRSLSHARCVSRSPALSLLLALFLFLFPLSKLFSHSTQCVSSQFYTLNSRILLHTVNSRTLKALHSEFTNSLCTTRLEFCRVTRISILF